MTTEQPKSIPDWQERTARKVAAAAEPAQRLAVPAWPALPGPPEMVSFAGRRPLCVVSRTVHGQIRTCDECGLPAPYGDKTVNGEHFHKSCLERSSDPASAPRRRMAWIVTRAPRETEAQRAAKVDYHARESSRIHDLVQLLPEDEIDDAGIEPGA